MDNDLFFALEDDIEAARELVETAGPELAQLFIYPGNRHLFADRSLPSATRTQQRWWHSAHGSSSTRWADPGKSRVSRSTEPGSCAAYCGDLTASLGVPNRHRSSDVAV